MKLANLELQVSYLLRRVNELSRELAALEYASIVAGTPAFHRAYEEITKELEATCAS
jgi:hypothetical protein